MQPHTNKEVSDGGRERGSQVTEELLVPMQRRWSSSHRWCVLRRSGAKILSISDVMCDGRRPSSGEDMRRSELRVRSRGLLGLRPRGGGRHWTTAARNGQRNTVQATIQGRSNHGRGGHAVEVVEF